MAPHWSVAWLHTGLLHGPKLFCCTAPNWSVAWPKLVCCMAVNWSVAWRPLTDYADMAQREPGPHHEPPSPVVILPSNPCSLAGWVGRRAAAPGQA
eukprot:363181-Chlamydomonas_euryale.AAC.11